MVVRTRGGRQNLPIQETPRPTSIPAYFYAPAVPAPSTRHASPRSSAHHCRHGARGVAYVCETEHSAWAELVLLAADDAGGDAGAFKRGMDRELGADADAEFEGVAGVEFVAGGCEGVCEGA